MTFDLKPPIIMLINYTNNKGAIMSTKNIIKSLSQDIESLKECIEFEELTNATFKRQMHAVLSSLEVRLAEIKEAC